MRPHRIVLIVFLTVSLPTFLHAQGNVGTVLPTLGTGTGAGNDTGTGGNTGESGIGNPATRTADEAFSNVQRGNSVGSTESTGASFSDVGNVGGLPGSGLGGFGGLGGGFGGLGGLFGGQATAGNQNSQPVIRTRLRSAIDHAVPTSDQVQQTAMRRFRSVPSRAGLSGVSVAVVDRTAILTGVVASQREHRMGELMARLEPGISRVENRIVVVPAN